MGCPAFLSIDRPKGRQPREDIELPKTTISKVGAATVAAGAGVILAITSVMAHSAPAATLHVTSTFAVASQMNALEERQDAVEAAALLAAEKKKAEALAAKVQREAAKAAEEAAESTATEAAEDSTVEETDNDTDNEATETEVDNDTDQTEVQDTGDHHDSGDAHDTESSDSGD
jgi:Skp family chaperone for outer membrane proteins